MKIFSPARRARLRAAGRSPACSSSSSSSWRTRSRSAAALVVDQIGLAAHDQHRPPRMVLGPEREARATSSAAASSSAAWRSRISVAQPRLRLGQGQAGKARADIIADLGERRGAGPAGGETIPGSRRCRRRRPPPPAPGAAQRHEGELLQRRLLLRHQHDAGAGDRPDSAAVAAASASSIGPPRSICASIARAPRPGAGACMMPSTNRRSPLSVGIRPAEVCGRASSPSSSRSCMTLRIEAGERLIDPASAFEPTGMAALEIGLDHQPEDIAARSLSSPIGWVMRVDVVASDRAIPAKAVSAKTKPVRAFAGMTSG